MQLRRSIQEPLYVIMCYGSLDTHGTSSHFQLQHIRRLMSQGAQKAGKRKAFMPPEMPSESMSVAFMSSHPVW